MDQAVMQDQGGVLANDLDYYSNPLTAQLVSGPSNGQLTLNGDGTFSYTPNPGFCGQDTFTYTATDGTDTAVPANGDHLRQLHPAGPGCRLLHRRWAAARR